MSIEVEFLYNTARIGGEFARRNISGDTLHLPREVLATYNGIASLFPERRSTVAEDITVISAYMPFLITLNEAVDLGISARLERRKASQHNFQSLLNLENKTFKDLEIRYQQFQEKYSEYGYIAWNATQDLTLLSTNREFFQVEEYPEYLEIDSGIFVGSTLSLLFPNQLFKNGFSMARRVSSIEGLKKKYEPFVLSTKPVMEYTDFMKRVRALHSVEMCMKVLDDKNGVDIDVRLGIPNYLVWMDQIKDKHALESLHNKYRNIAGQGGISEYIIRATEAVAYLSSTYKSDRQMKGVSWDDSYETLLKSVGTGRITTTLRHELFPLIYDIFSLK